MTVNIDSADNPGAAASVSALAAAWLKTAAERVQRLSALGFAEARLAALALASIVFFSMLAAVLALSAWGLLIALIVHLTTQTGLALWASLLLICIAHCGAAMWCWTRALQLTSYVEFPETRRHLALVRASSVDVA